MRLGYFLLGLLVGILCAVARGRAMWPRLRDVLAMAIDAIPRIGVPSIVK
jgi:hypothetical protein